mgnify:CR=1 FL=1
MPMMLCYDVSQPVYSCTAKCLLNLVRCGGVVRQDGGTWERDRRCGGGGGVWCVNVCTCCICACVYVYVCIYIYIIYI